MPETEAMMRAIIVRADPSRTMAWAAVAKPVVGPGEVLLRVRATALNRADLLQRRGLYPPPPGVTEVMGLEAAGEIEAVGPGVSLWKPGQRVCSLLAGGGYAEYAVCPVEQLLPIPEGLSFAQAAALPEALFTAYLNIYIEGELQPGKTALIHAGASGVGSAAIQLCAALGNPVYATASRAKLPLLAELGASRAIDREGEDFVAQVHEATSGRGVDLILDPVGGSYLARNIEVLAPQGVLVVIGLLGGNSGELALGQLLLRRLRIVGSVLRARPVADKGAIRDGLLARVWPHVEAGAIRPILHAEMSIAEVTQAHELLKSNSTSGKVVLHVP